MTIVIQGRVIGGDQLSDDDGHLRAGYQWWLAQGWQWSFTVRLLVMNSSIMTMVICSQVISDDQLSDDDRHLLLGY